MTEKQRKQWNTMYSALTTITKEYQTLTQLRRNNSEYALGYEEALEMSYENVRELAKVAVKGVKPLLELNKS